MSDYSFFAPWGGGQDNWGRAIGKFNPGAQKFLEIGSFEGKSATFLLDTVFLKDRPYELYCVDTWEGGEEYSQDSMPAAERNFDHNVNTSLQKDEHNQFKVIKLKGISSQVLTNLIANGHAGSFDFLYIDDSHQCPDVLTDLVLAFMLSRVGGIIVCDDYTWFPNVRQGNLLHSPKMAIDSFSNCFWDKVALTDQGSPGQPIFVKVGE